ncbi:hypothetical protein FGADI_3429 [Fusarium gaditjirri]|uniref:Uncharacterized protein n=1 Tax=Fusarium gaditjirri TaxID=282569 RepID=A0A8H4X116_9HYPO|nr:hypothetical protein FGADI_3429 [Fusarium gaditjirri]
MCNTTDFSTKLRLPNAVNMDISDRHILDNHRNEMNDTFDWTKNPSDRRAGPVGLAPQPQILVSLTPAFAWPASPSPSPDPSAAHHKPTSGRVTRASAFPGPTNDPDQEFVGWRFAPEDLMS